MEVKTSGIAERGCNRNLLISLRFQLLSDVLGGGGNFEIRFSKLEPL